MSLRPIFIDIILFTINKLNSFLQVSMSNIIIIMNTFSSNGSKYSLFDTGGKQKI